MSYNSFQSGTEKKKSLCWFVIVVLLLSFLSNSRSFLHKHCMESEDDSESGLLITWEAKVVADTN